MRHDAPEDDRRGLLRRREVLRALAGTVAGWSVARAARGAPARPPNLLVLFTDDQRFDTVAALGNPAVQTPNLDRLVRTGTAFTHCFIQGGVNGAVCISSRAQLITGRSLFHSPTVLLPEDHLALWPATFRDHGYTTFGTGKWHNGPWSYAQCFSQGASIFFGGMADHLKVPVYDFSPTGSYPRGGQHVGAKFSTELFSDAAIDFLRGHDHDRPFFAYVSYTAPHDPRMAPQEFVDLYPPDKIELPPNFLPEHPFDNGELKIRDEQLAPWPRTPEVVRQNIAAYYAMITHLDHHLGRVLDALEATGQAADTVIMFAGDNGLALGQHGLMGKQNLYEASVRVPLILAGPGIAAGRRCDGLVYLHDLFPTACELAGLEIPDTVESCSLVPLLRGHTTHGYDSLFAAYRDVQRMVRDERWKLIRYPKIRRAQLFDLEEDPWEMHDLSAAPGQAERIAALDAELRAWQLRTGDDLDLDHPPGAGNPVHADAKGVFVLRPEDARTTGNLRYQPDRQNLGGWTDPQDFADWHLVDVPAERYDVELTYGSTNPGVAFTIMAGDRELAGTTEDTGGLRIYHSFKVGRLELPAGQVTVAVKPGPFQGAVMNFRLLVLTPVSEP